MRYGKLMAATLAIAAIATTGCGRSDEAAGGSGAKASPGITDTTITIGATAPLSGPAAPTGTQTAGIKAAFDAENAKGGIDGRKLEYVVLDDAYDPAKALQNVKQLIERDQVFALAQSTGTASQTAAMPYILSKQVPSVFTGTGNSAFGDDPKGKPWVTGSIPTNTVEAQVYSRYLQQTKPNAKVAILYQNDAFGKEVVSAFQADIKGSNVKVVATRPFEATDATVAPQVTQLKRSGADVLYILVGTQPTLIQALKQRKALGWDALAITNYGATSNELLSDAGDASEGLVSAVWFKDPTSPEWANDAAVKEYQAQLAKSAPKVRTNASPPIFGYIDGLAVIAALKNMKEPTRESFMEAIRSLDVDVPLLIPGIKIQMSPTDGFPLESMQIRLWRGGHWESQGEPVTPGAKG
jgi:branched-chain amino acid transport system substrate-binding protein